MKIPEGIKCYGNPDYRNKKCPRETAEQVTFVNQLRLKYPDTFGLLVVHVRNEGKKTVQQVAREKMEGMAVGAPDIMIPGRVSFLCELKRQDRTLSTLQEGQLPYLMAAQGQGAFCCVAFGWEAAMEAFEEWRVSTTN